MLNILNPNEPIELEFVLVASEIRYHVKDCKSAECHFVCNERIQVDSIVFHPAHGLLAVSVNEATHLFPSHLINEMVYVNK